MTSTPNIFSDALTDQLIQNTSFHVNLAQDAIIITEDKVRLCLMKHLEGLEQRRQWIAPAGILATLMATFPTTTFNDFVGLKAATWQAVFFLAAVITGGWLVRAVIKSARAPTLDDVVAVMKKVSERK